MFNLPLELVQIIFKYLTLRDIRILNKMPEYSCYQNIFQKIITKDITLNIEYYQTVYKNQIMNHIKNDIKNICIGFNDDSERWSIKMYNEEKDKLDFYKNYLNKLENNKFYIVYFINEFHKIIQYLLLKYNRLSLNIYSPFKLLPTTPNYSLNLNGNRSYI
jgi:hypothetical protein